MWTIFEYVFSSFSTTLFTMLHSVARILHGVPGHDNAGIRERGTALLRLVRHEVHGLLKLAHGLALARVGDDDAGADGQEEKCELHGRDCWLEGS